MQSYHTISLADIGTEMTNPAEQRKRGRKLDKTGHQSDGEPDAGKLHVRICEGLEGAISLAYSPTYPESVETAASVAPNQETNPIREH